jgi:hypothetical protein
MNTSSNIRKGLDWVLDELKEIDSALRSGEKTEDSIFHSTVITGTIIESTYKERLAYLLGKKAAFEFCLGIK